MNPQETQTYFSAFGFVPESFFGQLSAPPNLGAMVWEWCTVYTSMFSHGGVFHLLGNMLFLYLFGDNMEDAMGKARYGIFYLSCGLLAALAQGFANPDSPIPMVGASGAISGVMAGYLLLYPRANVRFFYWFFIFIGSVYLPAYLLLGFWLVEQAIALPESMQQAGGVAIAAHLGGFGAGLALTPFFKRPGVRCSKADILVLFLAIFKTCVSLTLLAKPSFRIQKIGQIISNYHQADDLSFLFHGKAYQPSEDRLYEKWLKTGCFTGKEDKQKTPYSIVIPPPSVTGVLTMGTFWSGHPRKTSPTIGAFRRLIRNRPCRNSLRPKLSRRFAKKAGRGRIKDEQLLEHAALERQAWRHHPSPITSWDVPVIGTEAFTLDDDYSKAKPL